VEAVHRAYGELATLSGAVGPHGETFGGPELAADITNARAKLIKANKKLASDISWWNKVWRRTYWATPDAMQNPAQIKHDNWPQHQETILSLNNELHQGTALTQEDPDNTVYHPPTDFDAHQAEHQQWFEEKYAGALQTIGTYTGNWGKYLAACYQKHLNKILKIQGKNAAAQQRQDAKAADQQRWRKIVLNGEPKKFGDHFTAFGAWITGKPAPVEIGVVHMNDEGAMGNWEEMTPEQRVQVKAHHIAHPELVDEYGQ